MQEPSSTRVAMIGTEFMGRVHSQAWRSVAAFADVGTVELAVLVGRDPHKTTATARALGWAEASTDWRQAIARDDIDVVDICTPGHLHAEIAIAALAAGKHVLVEKPLASTISDAEAMVAAARGAQRSGVQSMVGYTYRRVPALAHARDLISSGRIGEVRQMRASFLQDWLVDPTAPMTWRLRRETAGSGVLGDLGSHLVDQVQFLLDDAISSVSGLDRTFIKERDGENGREAVTVDDAFWATATTTAGAVVSIEASRVASGRKSSLEVEVYGSEGAVRFDLERLNELRILDGAGVAEDRGFRTVLVTEARHPNVGRYWPPGHVLGWENAFTIQAGDFLTAIATGEPPAPSFEDGLAVERVLAAIESSARSNGVRTEVTA